MPNTTQQRTAGLISERIREKTVRRSVLLGLIQWDEVVSAERIGYDLNIISIHELPTRIFINGEEIHGTKA